MSFGLSINHRPNTFQTLCVLRVLVVTGVPPKGTQTSSLRPGLCDLFQRASLGLGNQFEGKYESKDGDK